MSSEESLEEILEECMAFLSNIYAVYIDIKMGFKKYLDWLVTVQQLVATEMRISTSELGNRRMVYADNDPTDKGCLIFHTGSQSELENRLYDKGGGNIYLVRNNIIIAIHSYWEEYFRSRIASLLECKEKDDVKSDIFGDLNKIRNDLLHHKSIAQRKNSGRCKIIKLEVGCKIEVPDDVFQEIFKSIIDYFNGISKEHLGKRLRSNYSLVPKRVGNQRN